MRKLKRVFGVYAVSAFAVLAILAALFAAHLRDFRCETRHAYELSFEQTAAAVDALSGTLEQCRYATGELCHGLASEAYAQASAAKSALSTLPFSTVEMEQTKSFLGTAGDFMHGLCARSGEFSDDERAALGPDFEPGRVDFARAALDELRHRPAVLSAAAVAPNPEGVDLLADVGGALRRFAVEALALGEPPHRPLAPGVERLVIRTAPAPAGLALSYAEFPL